jgi:uncharacterized membrane protein YfcA
LAGWIGLALVGLCLGALGAGGTSLALPALVYGMGLAPHQAVAASLVLVGVSSAIGGALHARKGAVRWRALLTVSPFGLAGAAIGASLSPLLSGGALLLCFGALVCVIGVRLWREAPPPIAALPRHSWLGAASLGIGLLTGLLGNGGGFLLVPALLRFGGLPIREAMATSLLASALNCAVAFAGHVSWQRTAPPALPLMLAVTVAGMWVGVEIAQRTRPEALRRAFAALLLLLGAWMVLRQLAL